MKKIKNKMDSFSINFITFSTNYETYYHFTIIVFYSYELENNIVMSVIWR